MPPPYVDVCFRVYKKLPLSILTNDFEKVIYYPSSLAIFGVVISNYAEK